MERKATHFAAKLKELESNLAQAYVRWEELES